MSNKSVIASSPRKRNVVGLIVAVTFIWSTLALSAPSKQPFRGAFPWSVLLCTNGTALPGEEQARLDRKKYRKQFFGKGKDSAATYWRRVSYGQLKLTGVVRGWFVAAHPYHIP